MRMFPSASCMQGRPTLFHSSQSLRLGAPADRLFPGFYELAAMRPAAMAPGSGSTRSVRTLGALEGKSASSSSDATATA